MSCLFCYPIEPKTPITREHVIPETIGGGLVMNAVCKDHNDRLGARVDVVLVDNFMIQMIRLGLRLPAKDGTIPTPLVDGRLVGTEEIASFRVAPGAAKGVVSVRNRVEQMPSEGGTVRKRIVAEPNQFEQIRAKLESRAQRGGYQMVLHGPEETNVVSPVVEKTEHLELSVLVRPILKIAFEYAALTFGDDYAATSSAAHLRDQILETLAPSTKMPFRIAPTGTVLSAGAWPSYFHAIRLIRSRDDIVCNLRIFNVFEASCRVASLKEVPHFSAAPITLFDPIEKIVTVPGESDVKPRPGTGIFIRRTNEAIVLTTTFDGPETATCRVELAQARTAG
jgi:hypothetical protein